MNRIAKFEKVSLEEFTKSWKDTFKEDSSEQILKIYQKLRLPERATAGSAGYDFFSPVDFTLEAQQEIKIPTGIRVQIENGWVLAIFPRSGLGFKYRLQLNNTVGIIDSDYYGSDNEGHIFIKLTNDSKDSKKLLVRQLEGFAQGIFLPFGITEDDASTEIRNGGFGSTTKEEK